MYLLPFLSVSTFILIIILIIRIYHKVDISTIIVILFFVGFVGWLFMGVLVPVKITKKDLSEFKLSYNKNYTLFYNKNDSIYYFNSNKQDSLFFRYHEIKDNLKAYELNSFNMYNYNISHSIYVYSNVDSITFNFKEINYN